MKKEARNVIKRRYGLSERYSGLKIQYMPKKRDGDANNTVLTILRSISSARAYLINVYIRIELTNIPKLSKIHILSKLVLSS